MNYFWTFLKNAGLSVFENLNSNLFLNQYHHHTRTPSSSLSSQLHLFSNTHFKEADTPTFVIQKTQELQNLNWWGYSYRKLSVILSITYFYTITHFLVKTNFKRLSSGNLYTRLHSPDNFPYIFSVEHYGAQIQNCKESRRVIFKLKLDFKNWP